VSAYVAGQSALSISKEFGLSWQTVIRRVSEIGIPIRRTGRVPPNELALPPETAARFRELVDGLLLGDGSIDRHGVLRLGQSVRHEEWVLGVKEDLEALGVPARVGYGGPTISKLDGRVIKSRGSVYVYTPTFKETKEQRVRWYDGDVKRVPADVVLTPTSVALWFCGDGTNFGDGLLSFCTDSFFEVDIDRLIMCLRRDFGVRATKSRAGLSSAGVLQHHINLCRRDDCVLIKEAVSSLIPSVFSYKLRGIRPAIPKGRALRRLTERQVLMIRSRHSSGESATHLGREYGVSNVTIANIVRRKIYRDVL